MSERECECACVCLDWCRIEQSLSAVDILAMANLLNYFGKCEWVRGGSVDAQWLSASHLSLCTTEPSPQVDEIDVNPVLLQKGTTKVAQFRRLPPLCSGRVSCCAVLAVDCTMSLRLLCLAWAPSEMPVLTACSNKAR